MTEVAIEDVKVDRCAGCGGVFLDKGELAMLTHSRNPLLLQTAFRTVSRGHAIELFRGVSSTMLSLQPVLRRVDCPKGWMRPSGYLRIYA